MQYPNLSRRGFMSALGALAATVSAAAVLPPKIILLSETENEEPADQLKDWVTDKGDYYAVRIPDGKILMHETFDKSVVFYMGDRTALSCVAVHGFTNFILTTPNHRVEDSVFDSRHAVLTNGKQRASVYFDKKYTNGGLYVTGNRLLNENYQAPWNIYPEATLNSTGGALGIQPIQGKALV